MKNTKPSKETLENLYLDQQLSCDKIAKKLGFGHTSINNWLKQYKIPIRTQGETRTRNILNKKFSKLLVIKQDGKKCTCLCDCGKITIVINSSLIHGNTKTCGCSHTNIGNTNCNWTGIGEISTSWFNNIKYSAIKRNINFNINIEQVWNLYLKQDKKCGLTNLNLFFNKSSKILDGNISIDRIDSSQDYNINNIWLVHKDVNIIKYTYNLNQLYYYIELIMNPVNISNNIELERNPKRAHNFTGYKLIEGAHWLDIINSAKSRNLVFEISIKQIWNKFVKQRGNCALSGLPLTFGCNIRKKGNGTASLDRIDSNKGYTIDNIQWIHKNIQRMKWWFDENIFIEYCKLINNNKQNTFNLLEIIGIYD